MGYVTLTVSFSAIFVAFSSFRTESQDIGKERMNPMENTHSRIAVSIREGSSSGSLNLTEASLPGNTFEFRTLEGVLDGDRDFGLFAVDLTPGEWRVSDNTYAYQWRFPADIVVDFLAVNELNRLSLTYTVTNHGNTILERVQIHPCIPTMEAPAFRPQKDPPPPADAPVTYYDRRESERLPCAETFFELYDRITVWSEGKPVRFSQTQAGRSEVHLALMKQGEAPINWAWWNNAPECFDVPIIALESNQRDACIALGFERAIWASANVGDDRACFHLFPFLGRIQPGQSSTTSGALYLERGSVESVRGRFIKEFPHALRNSFQ